MRYVKIFFLHFQDVFQNRSRLIVWFIISLVNPFLFLVYWQGVIAEQSVSNPLWTLNSITSYYLLITIATAFLLVHVEEDIAWRDIKEGALAKYLVRPFSYFIHKFMEEMPWRILQGSMGLIVFVLFALFLHISLPLAHDVLKVSLAIVIVLLALAVSFVFKMALGMTALWTTDFWGTLALEEIAMLLFGGLAMPISLYPPFLELASRILPFAYIVYFPVVAIEGLLPISELLWVIGVQCVWLGIFIGLYKGVWALGIKKFTAIGQ